LLLSTLNTACAMWPQPALAKQVLEQEYVTVSGPDEARKAVREKLAIGADLIKLPSMLALETSGNPDATH
jgi:hypothetical protein